MKKDLTLLVMAAGMGSRFGELKQIEPVGPNGEFIIDYSIYDAIVAGFNKVVFVIKEENYDVFKNTIGSRIEDKIKVEYVFQKMTDVPEGLIIPEDRVKPLGTAHAIYAARNVIHENFAVINADDLYGRDGYLQAAEFLKECADDEYANIAYKVYNTLTENGSVCRGVIFSENGYITKMVESRVQEKEGKIIAEPLSGDKTFEITKDTPVSMNLMCYTPLLFDYIGRTIKDYFEICSDIMKSEYLIPDISLASAKENGKPIKCILTNSKYYGMTYKEDLIELKNGILKEIESGTYNNNLWG